ncbi:MAG TPA: LssY C-terminal domain-containing protein [Candidatus Saccharimonadales bacterium]|nr:LssY C-terminal domain-containing protein [Candidatus Saccharimonadales bacterium]
MIQRSFRLAARFAILIPGVVIAYVSVSKIYPYFDSKLPLGLAILLTYILAAYILIPALIRLIRIIKPPAHLPLYCVTPDGFASDPLNIGIIATRRQIILAMEKAGWHLADPHRWRYLVRHLLSTIYGWSYPNAPVSNLYLFGRKQDLAFEIPIEGQVGGRHHVRFWATTYENKRPLSFRSIHWQHRQAHLRDDNLLWIGAASQDVGVGYIRHNMQLTHMIDPDTNSERELIVKHLRAYKLIENIETVKLGKPYRLINRVMRGQLHTDGKMAVISLQAGFGQAGLSHPQKNHN